MVKFENKNVARAVASIKKLKIRDPEIRAALLGALQWLYVLDQEVGKHKAQKVKLPIMCLQNKTVYNSQKEAADALSLAQGNISRHLKGHLKSVQGFTFEYVEK